MDTPILFDPTVEKLNAIVAETSKIQIADLSDDAQLEVVKSTRIQLRDFRVAIEKTGKGYREAALAHNKAVIAKERELIAIIEPEEIRLKAIEEEAKQIRERAARAELLPMRKEMLAKFVPTLTDEEILDMNNDQFMVLLNELTATKNETDRLEIETEKKRLAHEAELKAAADAAALAERNRIEADQKATETARIEKAAQEKRDAEVAAQKLIDDAKAEADRLVQEAKDNEAKRVAQAEATKREADVREQQARDEFAKREADEKYCEWAKTLGWTAETAMDFETKHIEGRIELWRKVGTY